MKPRVTVYRVANPGWRWVWNDYPAGRIGAAVVAGRWCLSLQWRRPPTEGATSESKEKG